MNLYLNYAAEHWTLPGENPPVGLILCSQKNAAVVKYALGNQDRVLAAEYRMALPDEKLIADHVVTARKEIAYRDLVLAKPTTRARRR